MKFASCFLFLTCLVSSSLSAQGPIKAPPGNWVQKVEFNAGAKPMAGQESGVYYLLVDRQTSLSRQEAFDHEVYKLLTTEGVQSYSDLNFDYDPSHSRLIIHELKIHRDGKIIDKLPAMFNTARRETSMDRYMYDGSLTCFINVPDVRVGDIVEYSYTIKGFNPIYQGHFADQIYLEFGVPVEKTRIRILSPTEKKLYTRDTGSPPTPAITKINQEDEYVWTTPPTPAAVTHSNAPSWFDNYKSVQVSDFAEWKDVAAWALPIYTLTPAEENELRKVAGPELAKASPLTVIRFVQDEIRYLSVNAGIHSHKPHKPSDVYRQRFGDCKDKSMLLCALLKLQNIEAHPVLISTGWASALDSRQPYINAFDHCIVQVNYNGSVFYIDPTISNQGGTIGHIPFPDYDRGLVLTPENNGLTTLPPDRTGETNEYVDYTLDKIDGDAKLDVRTVYHGSDADSRRAEFASQSRKDIEEHYTAYYGNLHPTITVSDSITFTDDRDANEFAVNEHYSIPHAWTLSQEKGKDSVVQFEVYALSMERYFNISKSENRTAPYALPYPVHYTTEINVFLPSEWPIKPDKRRISEPEYSFSYSIGPSQYPGQNKAVIEMSYQTNADHVPREKFQKFAKDHAAMKSNLSYVLTFDKSIAGKFATTGPLGIVIFLVCGLGMAGLAIYLYRRYDPPARIAGFSVDDAEPIGGWLILLAIGITLSPFVLMFSMLKDDFVVSLRWPTLLSGGQTGLACTLLAEQVSNLAMLALSILVAILFYQRRTSFPTLAIILFAIRAAVQVGDTVAIHALDLDTTGDNKAIISAVTAAIVWIPYLLMSSRVNETFVFRREVAEQKTVATPDALPPANP